MNILKIYYDLSCCMPYFSGFMKSIIATFIRPATASPMSRKSVFRSRASLTITMLRRANEIRKIGP